VDQPIDLVRYIVYDSTILLRARITWENRTEIANVTHMPAPETMRDRTTPEPDFTPDQLLCTAS